MILPAPASPTSAPTTLCNPSTDFRQLGDRSPSEGGDWPRSPSAAVLVDAKQARALEAAEKSCVSQFCRDDQMCQDLSVYGYSCNSCLMVSGNIGNCQQF
ncbi:hypothetical protein F4820DRAFT_451180 [Hypoxylon rubiginosum]|uniref:Uncharacterized protein n=1 Tax=Hypoxylon rubiginosum TaxID=110542 RepID=A0ACB9YU02_9PEZI|nr:hypothetical protein F4820DRAFT_451180 [Hypoxylon rubiginosum]